MSQSDFPKAILDKAKSIRGKRSRIVVDHILRQGSITTEDLEKYGYKHPPRAIRDVREQGLPLDRFWTKNRDGRRIAGYRFGDPTGIRHDRLGGRMVLSRELQKQVYNDHRSRCGICLTKYERRYLQVDHRVPYEVEGDPADVSPQDYMPLCVSCNRAKSWSCEHCKNWIDVKNAEICRKCYWASPEAYDHIATHAIRRLDVAWKGKAVSEYDALLQMAGERGERLPEFVKSVLRRVVRDAVRGQRRPK